MFDTLKIEIFNERHCINLVEQCLMSSLRTTNFINYLFVSRYPVKQDIREYDNFLRLHTIDRMEMDNVKLINVYEKSDGFEFSFSKILGCSFDRVFVSAEYLNLPVRLLQNILPSIRN